MLISSSEFQSLVTGRNAEGSPNCIASIALYLQPYADGEDPQVLFDHTTFDAELQINLKAKYAYLGLVFSSYRDEDLRLFFKGAHDYIDYDEDFTGKYKLVLTLSVAPKENPHNCILTADFPVFYAIEPEIVGGEFNILRFAFERSDVHLNFDVLSGNELPIVFGIDDILPFIEGSLVHMGEKFEKEYDEVLDVDTQEVLDSVEDVQDAQDAQDAQPVILPEAESVKIEDADFVEPEEVAIEEPVQDEPSVQEIVNNIPVIDLSQDFILPAVEDLPEVKPFEDIVKDAPQTEEKQEAKPSSADDFFAMLNFDDILGTSQKAEPIKIEEPVKTEEPVAIVEPITPSVIKEEETTNEEDEEDDDYDPYA